MRVHQAYAGSYRVRYNEIYSSAGDPNAGKNGQTVLRVTRERFPCEKAGARQHV